MQFADYLIAHRGYPARLPENTLPSIEAALQAGARYIEVDVQLSKDAEPVLFHDRNLQRLCDRDGAIHDYDWQEIQEFRIQEHALPHIKELVALLRQHPEVTVFIELKRISLEHFGCQTVLAQVLPELQAIKTQVVLISYSLEVMQLLRDNDDYPVGVVIDDWPEREQAAILAIKPEYLFCNLESIPVTGELECKDCQLVVFECTDPQQASSLLQRGVSLVETFAIGEMLTAMASLGAPLSSG
jgi:glycerophosphoryl diester phosphodiesterase